MWRFSPFHLWHLILHIILLLTKWNLIKWIQIKFSLYFDFLYRYLHVLQPAVGAGVAARRSSVPVVSSSSVGHAPSDRRGSEPALLQAELMSRQEVSRSESDINISDLRHSSNPVATDIVEEQPQGIGFFFFISRFDYLNTCSGCGQFL